MANRIEAYATELCREAEGHNIPLRLFGSCAIRIKCRDYSDILDRCNRYPKDIDCVIPRACRKALRAMLLSSGWRENVELTAQTDGNQIQLSHSAHNLVLDVCVDALRFAQTLDVRKRIEV